MDYKYINQLLERYWQGETSLEEEEILRTFFSQISIPEELEPYRALFVFQTTEANAETLGDDFDERLLNIIDEPMPVKARRITLTQRLAPLFKAAAVVAIILTLGNAIQVPFRSQQTGTGSMEAGISSQEPGASMAYTNDSTSIDTLQQSNLDALPEEDQMSIIK